MDRAIRSCRPSWTSLELTSDDLPRLRECREKQTISLEVTCYHRLCEHGGCQEQIADSVSDLEAARLMTLACAAAMDKHGARGARDKIAAIKVAVPELTGRVVDRAVQVFGGAGVSDDFPLARALAGLRSLRIADGPDAVHKRTVALMEIKKAKRAMKHQSRL